MRHQLALEMLAKNGACLPHSWISGNDEMGSPYGLWRRLAAFRWCWTGAAAWGRVAPLGWLQRDGRETGGYGRLWGRRLDDPSSSVSRERPRARTEAKATTLTTACDGSTGLSIPGRGASGRQGRCDFHPRRGRTAGRAQMDGRNVRRQIAHRPVDRNGGRGGLTSPITVHGAQRGL